MKKVLVFVLLVLSVIPMFGASALSKLSNPSLESARDFFNWEVVKRPVYNGDGVVIHGYNEFISTKGNTLHVGNDTYNPAQPLIAFDKTIEAMTQLGLPYSVNGVGSFDNDVNIFAQFDVNGTGAGYGYKGSKFSVGGKEYQGLITMAKGNDSSLPLSYWLTIICIVCANTFRAALKARKGNAQCVTMKQTKNSQVAGGRFDSIQDEIVALFRLQETVQATLERMAKQSVSLNEAEKAFLGLIKPIGDNSDLSKTGKTRLENSLESYVAAFKSSPGISGGNTREDWFNAVTNVATHGNTDSKNYDAAKQFISSEFGTYATRKETAFAVASNDQTWEAMVATGEEVLQGLLSRPVTVIQPVPSNDLGRLLAMK
jgi:hypothetical protein